jgi:hypothetical protein
MASPQRVHVTHTFTSDPVTVFDRLSEHENLGPVLGAKVTRVKDGDTSRNGTGSTRSVKVGPLPAVHETTTVLEPHTLIEYTITRQILTPTPDGGTLLDYTIGFDLPVPGAAGLVGRVLQRAIAKGIGTLAP